MKTLLSAAAVLALATGAAQAQPDPNGRDAHRDSRPAARQSQPAPARSYAPPARGYAPPARSYAPPPARNYAPPARGYAPRGQQSQGPARSYAPANGYRGAGQYGPGTGANGYRGHGPGLAPRSGYQPRNGATPGYSRSRDRQAGDRQAGDNRGGQDRGQWRGGWSGERSFHAERRFHDDGYRYQRGWYPREWGYGEYLPFGWFGQDYWLDFGAYDLPSPPYGAEWVRVGNDALLVDMASGEVISVEYGLFD